MITYRLKLLSYVTWISQSNIVPKGGLFSYWIKWLKSVKNAMARPVFLWRMISIPPRQADGQRSSDYWEILEKIIEGKIEFIYTETLNYVKNKSMKDENLW